MGVIVIFRALGGLLTLFGALMMVPALVALSENSAVAQSYLFSMVITVFAGGGLLLSTRGRRRSGGLKSAIFLATLWWIVTPFFGALPFLLEGMTPINSYFEAVSALTTTGAWQSEALARTSKPDMIWRALMQWSGGLASLAIAAVIFIRPAFVGTDTLLPPFSRGDRNSYIRAMRNAMFMFFRVYVLLTVIVGILLFLSGIEAFNAIVMSLSAVASGGFIPFADGANGLSNISAGILLPVFFVSGANFVLITRLFLTKETSLKDAETGVYGLIAFGVTLLLILYSLPVSIEFIPRYTFNAVSMLSTNGVFIGAPPPLIICLVTVLIGGTAISTAGGLKVLRWLVVMRRTREELRKLSSPNAVFGQVNSQNELGVWMHFLVFTLVLGILLVSITAGGHSFALSATAAVGVLSNAGPILGLVDGGANGYAVFSGDFQKVMLITGMILGRVEAVAALALFNRSFWRS